MSKRSATTTATDVDGGRFQRVVGGIVGKRLTYADLTGSGYDASVRKAGSPMAKDQPPPESKKDTSTPYQKFDALAKRVIRAPKPKPK